MLHTTWPETDPRGAGRRATTTGESPLEHAPTELAAAGWPPATPASAAAPCRDQSAVPAITALSVTGLTLVRGERCLIAGLDLRLEAGAAVQVRGPNGSGKTTLLRAIAGLARPESGAIRWHGAAGPLTGPVPIAYLGHRSGLKADLTPREELRFALRLQGAADPQAVDAALERMGVAACADLPCGGLSAGQRRRVALARVLAGAAPIWILDEPLTALDAQGCADFGRLLAEHLRRGGLALLSTHQPLALEADRLATLHLETPA